MTVQERVDEFLDGSAHAIVGASRDRAKYGNKVLRAYLQKNRLVFPVNPNADEVEGVKAYPNLASLPQTVHGISVITPPDVTDAIVEQAGKLGIKNVWMQPGAESERAVERAEQLGMSVISGGPCALVALGYHDGGTIDSP